MDHALLWREDAQAIPREEGVVGLCCCTPDLCHNTEKGALAGIGEGLLLLLLRAATPEMAWQTHQGLGWAGLWFGASFLEG